MQFLTVLASLAVANSAGIQDKPMKVESEKQLRWFNVPDPLKLEDLKGKVVLLDFWTYG